MSNPLPLGNDPLGPSPQNFCCPPWGGGGEGGGGGGLSIISGTTQWKFIRIGQNIQTEAEVLY